MSQEIEQKHQPVTKAKMKLIAQSLLLSVCLYCYADDTNNIAKSDWSKSVELRNVETLHDHQIRGRLLIVAGNEPAYGGPKSDNAAMTFVELQNVTGACCENVDVRFDSMKLKCVLTDERGHEVQKATGVFAYSGRGPLGPYWVTLPYNSTIRLFVNDGSKSPLLVYQNGERWPRWSISPGDTNAYYLSGTLDVYTRTNSESAQSPYALQQCKGTLIFPKTKISSQK